MDMLTPYFQPGVFTVLRTYILVTTVMGNYRPINGYVDTHIFTFSTLLTHIFSPFLPVVYCTR